MEDLDEAGVLSVRYQLISRRFKSGSLILRCPMRLERRPKKAATATVAAFVKQ